MIGQLDVGEIVEVTGEDSARIRSAALRLADEFDTRLPHWFGAADDHPVEVLSLFGKQGEKIHMRTRPRR